MDTKASIRQLASGDDRRGFRDAVQAAKAGDERGQARVAATMVWAGFACPDAIQPVYDLLSAEWLGSGHFSDVPPGLTEAPLEASFWQAFFSVIDDAEQGYDAASITARVAALGGAVHPSYGQISEHCARNHPGATAALINPVPGRTDPSQLKSSKEGTLGKTLYRMIVDQGYDLEVLDREAIALAALPPCLRYLNTRILQMHDVWHLVAGYQTSASHEIAISAFQLAQFGHNYSAMFLATITTIACVFQRAGFAILMQLIAEGWRHGRETPPMMDIQWEAEWNKRIDAIRDAYGIQPYQSVLPADLFESMAG